MGDVRLEKSAADNGESDLLVERNSEVLRLEPQGLKLGTSASDIGYDRVHQSDAEIPAAPCLEDGHSLDSCNAGLIDTPARPVDRDAAINTQDVTANVLLFIAFEAYVDLLLDFKHQVPHDAAAAVVMLLSASENNHRFCRVACP